MRKEWTLALFIAVLIVVFIYRKAFIEDSNKRKYEGYKFYEIYFQEENQFIIIKSKFYQSIHILHWKNYKLMRILLPPEMDLEFTEFLMEQELKFQKISDNLTQLQKKQLNHNRSKRSTPMRLIDFTKYHRYDSINNYLISLAQKHPDKAKIYFAGKSYEDRDINALYISNTVDLNNTMGLRPLIIIDAGIHAREWIAPATALYIIKQLVENSKIYNDELALSDWLILPLVNPDGYEYSHEKDRMWRKNRKPGGKSENGIECIGTDLNRNFGYYWGISGSSSKPCSVIYRGNSPFSEPESVAVRDMLLKFNSTCFMYLTLHSYGPYIMYPWGYKHAFANNWHYLQDIARAGAEAIKKASGTNYKIGARSFLLYVTSGSSDDFAYGAANIKASLCMELPGNDFDPPTEEILPIVSETWLGIRAMSIEAYSETLRNNAAKISSNIIFIVVMTNICHLFTQKYA